MVRAYDDYGNVVDLVEWEKQIKEKLQNELSTGLYVDGFNDGYKKGRADANAENEISYDVGYEKGREDYEAECQKIFEDNPPMHFNHEQIMWLKEFVKIRCNQARADAIDECIKFIKNSIPSEEAFTKCLLVKGLEQLKEQNIK